MRLLVHATTPFWIFQPFINSELEEEMFLRYFLLACQVLDLCSWTAGWWRPSRARLCSEDKPRSGPAHSGDLKETGVPPPAPPLCPLCTGWWHLGEKQETNSLLRLCFLLWTGICFCITATVRKNSPPFTYGVDPDAKFRGVEGHRQIIRVVVDGDWVLMDCSSQQRSCCVVTVQHRCQQRRGLLLCPAHCDCHALSWWHTASKASWPRIFTKFNVLHA